MPCAKIGTKAVHIVNQIFLYDSVSPIEKNMWIWETRDVTRSGPLTIIASDTLGISVSPVHGILGFTGSQKVPLNHKLKLLLEQFELLYPGTSR